MEGVSDFVVVTQGICFLCRDKIKSSDQLSESILESIVKRNQSANQSIQYISHYLKMDMSKVFISDGAIPPHLLDKVKRLKLKVKLCEECSRLNETFSKLFRKLEKAEIEVAACLGKIVQKLIKEDQARTDDEVHKLAKCEPKNSALLEKLKIAEALREDSVQKCKKTRKIRGECARVRVKKLSPEDIPAKRIAYDRRRPSHEQGASVGGTEVGPASPDESESERMEMDYGQDDSLRQQSAALKVTVSKSQSTVNPQTGKVACNSCLKEFGSYIGFYLHYKAVHLTIRLKCDICHADFGHKHHLARHQRSVHFGQRFKCQFFSKTYKVNQMYRHKKTCNKRNRRQLTNQSGEILDANEEVTSENTSDSNVKQEADYDNKETNLHTPKLEKFDDKETAHDLQQ